MLLSHVAENHILTLCLAQSLVQCKDSLDKWSPFPHLVFSNKCKLREREVTMAAMVWTGPLVLFTSIINYSLILCSSLSVLSSEPIIFLLALIMNTFLSLSISITSPLVCLFVSISCHLFLWFSAKTLQVFTPSLWHVTD